MFWSDSVVARPSYPQFSNGIQATDIDTDGFHGPVLTGKGQEEHPFGTLCRLSLSGSSCL